MNHKMILFFILILFFAGLAIAGDVTVSLSGSNPLSVNIKGSSSNQQAGSISIYLYFCDDATTALDLSNVNDDQLETTWGWGNSFRTQDIQTGSWIKGGYTFTQRLFYDNADLGDQNDYWTTEGINALVCTFSPLGSGHAYIEVNGDDGLADWSANAHTITYTNQDIALPVELAAFSAVSTSEGVLLKWSTESEIKNLGFVLEKKIQGVTDFTTIASYKTHNALTGQGTSTSNTDYSFTDAQVAAGDSCTYRLSNVDLDGTRSFLSTFKMIVTQNVIPQTTKLLPAYPNPFNPETRITYQLHRNTRVTITVYDLLGRQVKTLVDDQHTAGLYHIIWNGTDAKGAKAASGAYLIRMQTQEETQTHKVLLLK
ncbi:MAG TPA: T9SS type A sorting domain-containing protein [bacterium]|nr:T9SS type A sorting domain-containing protein [bacterium]HPN44689.1 T9SS type A sorting domain-containing protein [bacterium]